MAAEGVDPNSIKLDWEKVKASQREKAMHEVKASMLLGRISEREAIHATREEVDREVARVAPSSVNPWPPCRCDSKRTERYGESPIIFRPKRL